MEMQLDETGTPYVMFGTQRVQFECEPFTEKFYREKAERELRETPEVVELALRELRALLKGEPGLSVPSENDEFLIKFLRPCKFYSSSAFQSMKKYYQFRQTHPQHCGELVPSRVRKPFESGVISVLSPRDRHGRRYMLIQAGEIWDHREIPLTDLFRGVQLALEAAMAEPRTQVCGVVTIFDMKGLSFSQVMQFTPMFAKMFVDFIQDCIPIRLKGVHVINQPYIFNMLFALFKPFLREKLRSRIHFHGTNRDSLLSHVDPEALRSRHGGTMPGPEIPGSVMWQMLSHYEDRFQLANTFGYADKVKK